MARQTPVNAGFTIVNGSGTGTNGNRIDVWMEYQLGQQRMLENVTPITVYFYAALAEGKQSSTALDYGMDSALKVDGELGTGVTNKGYYFTDSSYVNFLGSFSGDIYHDADGTKLLSLEGSFTTRSAYISGGAVSARVELPQIAKASTLGATDGDIGKTSVIAVSVKSSSYCHSIAYEFGALSGYISADGQHSDKEVRFTNTAIAFAIPESFYYEIPDAPTGICTLTCRTYEGETAIGDPQTARFTVTAPESACGPLLTGTAEDVHAATLALTGDKGVLILGCSTAKCVLEAQGVKGASIVQMRIDGEPVTENTVLLAQVQRRPVFWVQDSRGYTAQFIPAVTVLAYVPLTNNAAVSRDDPTSGNATVSLNGSFYDGSFGVAHNALTVCYRVNGGEAVEVQPQLNVDGGIYTGSFRIAGLDYDRSHRLELTVSDCLMQASQSLSVQKGMPVFDWGEHDFCFHVPVQLPQLQIGNQSLEELIRKIIREEEV